jgi:hypothetical protein
MSVSSLVVVGNALRLAHVRNPRDRGGDALACLSVVVARQDVA